MLEGHNRKDGRVEGPRSRWNTYSQAKKVGDGNRQHQRADLETHAQRRRVPNGSSGEGPL